MAELKLNGTRDGGFLVVKKRRVAADVQVLNLKEAIDCIPTNEGCRLDSRAVLNIKNILHNGGN